jgi:hypothetical protein
MRTCTRGCATGWGKVLVWIGIRMGLGLGGDVRLEERGSVGNTCCVDCSCGGGDWWWCCGDVVDVGSKLSRLSRGCAYVARGSVSALRIVAA